MKLKSVSMLTAIAISTAAPVGIRVKVGSDGEDTVCRVTFRDADAKACYCVKQLAAADCTAPDYAYVCNAEGPILLTAKNVRVEDAAWSLVDPSN